MSKSKSTPPVVELNERQNELSLVQDGTNYDGLPQNAYVVNPGLDGKDPLPASIISNGGEEVITVFVMSTQGHQTHVAVVSSPVDNTIYYRNATVEGYESDDVSAAVNKLIREIEAERHDL